MFLIQFLSDRKARIKVNDLIGEWIESLVGTSAGTVLGPILFLTHVHDSPLCIQYKIADDFASVVTAENVNQVESKLQDVLDEMEMWTENGT